MVTNARVAASLSRWGGAPRVLDETALAHIDGPDGQAYLAAVPAPLAGASHGEVVRCRSRSVFLGHRPVKVEWASSQDSPA